MPTRGDASNRRSFAAVPWRGDAQARPVPVKGLQIVTTFATEEEQVARVRVGLERVRHLRRQAVEAVAHADRPAGQVHLGAGRDLDHARPRSTFRTRSSARSFTNASTRTRKPPGR